MLGIRKNYISWEDIRSSAYKQYNFWINLAIEDIKNAIKKNSPNPNRIKIPKDAISIQESYKNVFKFCDPKNCKELEYPIGLLNLRINAELKNDDKNFIMERNTFQHGYL
jgi:hypothetical protein